MLCRSFCLDRGWLSVSAEGFAQELWSSRVNKERTDVEFQVDEKIFPARSQLIGPFWPPGVRLQRLSFQLIESSSPSTVSIPDVDPTVFEDVLYFRYTGSIHQTTRRLWNKLTRNVFRMLRGFTKSRRSATWWRNKWTKMRFMQSFWQSFDLSVSFSIKL